MNHHSHLQKKEKLIALGGPTSGHRALIKKGESADEHFKMSRLSITSEVHHLAASPARKMPLQEKSKMNAFFIITWN